MSDNLFDPKSIMETYKNAFAPALKVQQEGVKVIDRIGRYQYAVAGDYLEWSLAQAKLALAAQTPADFFSKQVELTTSLSEKLRARAQEFATIATESQAGLAGAVKESATTFVATTTKAAEAATKFEEPKKKVG